MSTFTGGKWHGQPLPSVGKLRLRPTSSRVRRVLFDSLGAVDGFRVLDLYSGTGALGFEALSRGAASVVSIDKSSKAILKQKQWAEQHLPAAAYKGYAASLPGALKRLSGGFELIMADPPYSQPLKSDMLMSLVELLAPEGWLVYETDVHLKEIPQAEGLTLARDKKVGETRLLFYRNQGVGS